MSDSCPTEWQGFLSLGALAMPQVFRVLGGVLGGPCAPVSRSEDSDVTRRTEDPQQGAGATASARQEGVQGWDPGAGDGGDRDSAFRAFREELQAFLWELVSADPAWAFKVASCLEADSRTVKSAAGKAMTDVC